MKKYPKLTSFKKVLLAKEKNPALDPVSMILLAEFPFIVNASMKLRAPTTLGLRAVDLSVFMIILNASMKVRGPATLSLRAVGFSVFMIIY